MRFTCTVNYKVYFELMLWAVDELKNGNRIKASKIFRVEERIVLK